MNITALIVTYNRLNKLKKTVQATLALPFKSVIVVDNASTDGTMEWLRTNCDKRLIVLPCNENTGGAGGFKYGSEWIVNNIETDWVLFYDDDAYPQADFFKRIQVELLTEKTVYACNVIDTHGTRCGMNIPWKKYPSSMLDNINYLVNSNGFIADGTKNDQIISVSFVGMLISKINLEKYYHFIDESLFIYFDDVYFSYHLHMNDIKMEYLMNLSVIHDVSQNTGYMAHWKVYYLIRNMMLSKHIFGSRRPFSNVYIFLRLIKYSVKALKHPEKKEYTKSLVRGVYDGICNHKWKR